MNRPLTAERLRQLLSYDPETGVFKWRSRRSGVRTAGMVAGNWSSSTGYCQIMIDKRNYTAHRLAWLYQTGAWPGCEIDHINTDCTDTRWVNLREATQTQNRGNTRVRSDNTSGFKGVSWYKRDRKWDARVKVNGKQVYLGRFDDQHDAALVYAAAAYGAFGEFARAEVMDEMLSILGPRH